MSASAETTQVELGFDGSGVLRCALAQTELARLERAYVAGKDGPIELATEEGKLTVDLRRVVYLRQLPGSRPVSFRA
jgi:hypothetical protein